MHKQLFEPLSKEFGEDIVITIIMSLLAEEIFQSESKAKIAFPALYHTSATSSKQTNDPDQTAVKSKAKKEGGMNQLATSHEGESSIHDNSIPDDDSIDHTAGNVTADLPSLHLTYETQHKLLNAIQHLLEQCCYDWVKLWFPDLLHERDWDCAQAVELSKWHEVLSSRVRNISPEATTLASGDDLMSTLRATLPLRNAAVHRVPTSAKDIEEMLNNALTLVKALCNNSMVLKLETILDDFRSNIHDMELHRKQLGNALDEKLCHLQVQKTVLDREGKRPKKTWSNKI